MRITRDSSRVEQVFLGLAARSIGTETRAYRKPMQTLRLLLKFRDAVNMAVSKAQGAGRVALGAINCPTGSCRCRTGGWGSTGQWGLVTLVTLRPCFGGRLLGSVGAPHGRLGL